MGQGHCLRLLIHFFCTGNACPVGTIRNQGPSSNLQRTSRIHWKIYMGQDVGLARRGSLPPTPQIALSFPHFPHPHTLAPSAKNTKAFGPKAGCRMNIVPILHPRFEMDVAHCCHECAWQNNTQKHGVLKQQHTLATKKLSWLIGATGAREKSLLRSASPPRRESAPSNEPKWLILQSSVRFSRIMAPHGFIRTPIVTK